jgi:hypothetical protein
MHNHEHIHKYKLKLNSGKDQELNNYNITPTYLGPYEYDN